MMTMRKILNVLALLTLWVLAALVVISAPGCQLIGPPVADKVADALDRYCAEPLAARQLIRETVNSQSPHRIQVTCVGDPQ